MGLGISFGFGPLRFSARTGGGGGGGGDDDNTWLLMLLAYGLGVVIVTTIVGWIVGFFDNLGIDIEFVLLYWVIFQGVPVALVLASSIFLTVLIFELIDRDKDWPKRFVFALPVCVFISPIIFIVGFHKIPLMNSDLVMLSQEESWELYGRNNAAFVAPVGHWLYLYLGASFLAPTIILVIFLGTKFFLRQTVRVLDSKATKKEALD